MKAVGIVLAGGHTHRMKELTNTRAIAAMPVAGSFRAIDFVLSNMANSHVQKVGVITQFNAASLQKHLSSSKWWDFGRKQGGLTVFTPNMTPDNSQWFRGTADAIYQNIGYLKESHEPYVIISSGDCVYKMDYNALLEYHIDKQADVTVVVKDMEKDAQVERYGTIKMNEEARITDFEEKPVLAKSNTVSCGIYVIRRRLLIEMIEKCAEEDQYDFVRDILIRYRDVKRIYGYKLKTYWRNIASVDDYYQANMDFLKADVRDFFFRQYPHISTKIDDLPPAKYNHGVKVENSLVASGSIINGSLENSLVFKNGFIGNGSVIRNSIVLNDVYIGNNVTIENCIVESRSTIPENSYYKGDGDIRIIMERGNRYII